jgi:hypothetical protein
MPSSACIGLFQILATDGNPGRSCRFRHGSVSVNP